MSVDLVGIRNVGEFYSQHYLDSLFASDLKDLTKIWNDTEKEGGAKAPPKRLLALGNTFFRLAAQAAGESDPVRRLELAQEHHAAFIEALGYQRRPAIELLEDGRVIPVALSESYQGKPWLWVVEAPFAASEDDEDPLQDGR